MPVLGGNTVIMQAVRAEPSLHQPMCYFLSMLSFSDVAMSVATLPTVLRTFCLNARTIDFDACLIQMFLIHSFSMMGQAFCWPWALTAMWPFVIPCAMPLCSLTKSSLECGFSCDSFGALSSSSSSLSFQEASYLQIQCPFPLLLPSPRHDEAGLCWHHYQQHLWTLFVLMSTFGMDLLFIFPPMCSFCTQSWPLPPVRNALKLSNTCVSHILAVLAFYVPMIGVSTVHRFGKHVPRYIHVLLSNIYLFVPPVLNPLIYSAKTKEIRRAIIRMFHRIKNVTLTFGFKIWCLL